MRIFTTVAIIVNLQVILSFPSAAGAAGKKNMDSFTAVDPATGRTIIEYDQKDFLHRDFPTGSLIKIFTLIAAMNQGLPVDKITVTCRPSSRRTDPFDACWLRSGHGKFGVYQAVACSCNAYFRALAEKIRPEVFWKVLSDYGLIEEGDIAHWRKWPRRDILEAMVGTGSRLTLPPRKLLYAYAALFNGGVLYRESRFFEGNQPELTSRRVAQNPAVIRAIHEGMQECCVYGSGADAQVTTNRGGVAGKTGTAAYCLSGKVDNNKTHGLFIGFYPSTGTPRIGIIVFSLEGVGSKAADIAEPILYVLSLATGGI